MIGLGIAIALLISSVVCADGGDPVLVAAQLIAAGMFYCGSMMYMNWIQTAKIKDKLELNNKLSTLDLVDKLPADEKEPTMNEIRELWGLDRVE